MFDSWLLPPDPRLLTEAWARGPARPAPQGGAAGGLPVTIWLAV